MPDIHWHVGEDAEQETIADTTSARRSRRSWIAIVIVVMLGAGLGMVYRSIPEPAPHPTPQLIPTLPAMPAKLFDTIDREAQALADGDRATLDSIAAIPNHARYQALMGDFKTWGRPTAAALYFIEDYRQLAADKAWVEVRQFHIDRFVQEVRFYQLRSGQWRRTDFDPSFWSGQVETADTPHFRFTYFIEDQELIESLASVLEADYEQICRDFACPATPETCMATLGQQWCSSFPRTITTTLVLTNQVEQHDDFDLTDKGDLTFTTQSPRLLDQSMPADREHYFRNSLAWLHMMRLAYGSRSLREMPDRLPPGHALVIAIFSREYDRLSKRTGSHPLEMPDEFKQLDTANPPSLDVVWDTDFTGANAAQIYAIAYSAVTYIDQEFGEQAVTRLLNAVGSSRSLTETLETSTGQPYAEFEQDWRVWVKANFSLLPSVPAELRTMIDLEAQALADGDLQGYLAMQTPHSTTGTSASSGNDCIQCNILPAWGRPAEGQPLYTIISATLRTPTKAWADIRQFRNGGWFRQTRFYQFNAEEQRWLRSEPDFFFWSGQTETRDTPHFHVIYAVEDRDVIATLTDQLEAFYPLACRDLGCVEATAELTYTLNFQGDSRGRLHLSEDARELTFPAPRLAGVFEGGRLYGDYDWYWGLVVAATQRAYYLAATQWTGNAPGRIVFNSIINWAMEQFRDKPVDPAVLAGYFQTQKLAPLEDLWGPAYVLDRQQQVIVPRTDTNVLYPEGDWVIHFIAQEYGVQSMPKLLKALDTAHSFADVIENGLGIPFAEFDQKWQAWVKSNLD